MELGLSDRFFLFLLSKFDGGGCSLPITFEFYVDGVVEQVFTLVFLNVRIVIHWNVASVIF